ncbi:hypothetical protein B5M44_25390, partial [Shinella sumterensis]
ANASRETTQEHSLRPIIAEGSYILEAGSTSTDRVMGRNDRPTAIVVANDLFALGQTNWLAGATASARRDQGVLMPC